MHYLFHTTIPCASQQAIFSSPLSEFVGMSLMHAMPVLRTYTHMHRRLFRTRLQALPDVKYVICVQDSNGRMGDEQFGCMQSSKRIIRFRLLQNY